MKPRSLFLATAALVAVAASVPADPPTFGDPLAITNPYHPFVVGREKRFEVRQGGVDAQVEDVYLPDVRTFAWNGGTVACRTLRETEIEDGEILEISWNWFAQADDGTVYYFGEVVDVYEGGVVVDHGGSWLVGGPAAGDPPDTAVAADPTVSMPADPERGDVFKPEDLYPFVDETDEIVKVDRTVRVPAGEFDGCIQVRESSLLSSGTETKWYAPGTGVVRVREAGSVLELVEVVD